MLSDVIILVAAATLLLIGLQSFLDPMRRKVASEVLKATFLMVMGLYLAYFWYTGVSATRASGGSYYS
jgi:apolipoprotein N-acyltransferase